jgi:molecular chaperone DnaK (HSP70)
VGGIVGIDPGTAASCAMTLDAAGEPKLVVLPTDSPPAPEERLARFFAAVRAASGAEGAVLAAPAALDQARRVALADAARAAGLDPRRLVQASTAAALGAGAHRRQSGRVIVCHLGVDGLEVAALDVEDGVVEVVATISDPEVSAAAIRARIVTRLAGEIADAHGVRVEDQPALARRLDDEAERLERALADGGQAIVQLPTIPPQGFVRVVKRRELETWIADLVEGLDDVCRLLVAQSGGRGVDALILSGSSSRAPGIERRVEQIFARPAEVGPARDELVARGAAIHAGILEGRVAASVLELAGRTVGLHAGGGRLTPVIRRLARLPAREHRIVQTARDDQREILLELVEGDADEVGGNRRTLTVTLGALPRAPAGEVSVLVDFTLDVDGLLRVDARDLVTGAPASVRVAPGA